MSLDLEGPRKEVVSQNSFDKPKLGLVDTGSNGLEKQTNSFPSLDGQTCNITLHPFEFKRLFAPV
jgi:hypothetical protein